MKKAWLAVVGILIITGFLVQRSWAKTEPDAHSPRYEKNWDDMSAKEMKKGWGMRSSASMGVSEDGIFVFTGNKILKYDSDLNLVKEKDLPADAMPGKFCPMCQKMMNQEEETGVVSKTGA